MERNYMKYRIHNEATGEFIGIKSLHEFLESKRPNVVRWRYTAGSMHDITVTCRDGDNVHCYNLTLTAPEGFKSFDDFQKYSINEWMEMNRMDFEKIKALPSEALANEIIYTDWYVPGIQTKQQLTWLLDEMRGR